MTSASFIQTPRVSQGSGGLLLELAHSELRTKESLFS